MPRVIISSGHSAANPGVSANGLQEYDLARKIAKYALKYIRLNGIISLSVPPNMELKERIDWINRTGYMRETNDIAIEIHINDGDRSGLEGWFEGDGGNPSQGVAVQVLDAVSRESGLANLGARSEFQHPMGSIAFVHELSPHSIILECGYIDNESDAAFLKVEHNLDSCGRGIAKGILNYYGLEYREAVPAYNPSGVIQAPAAAPVATQPAPQATAPVYAPPAYTPPVEAQRINYGYQQPASQAPSGYTAPAPVATPAQPAPAAPVAPASPTPTIRAQSDDYDEEYTDYDDDYDDDLIKTPTAAKPAATSNTVPQATIAGAGNPAPGAITRPAPVVSGSQSSLQGYSNPAAASPASTSPASAGYGSSYGSSNYGAPAYPGSYSAPASAGSATGSPAGATANSFPSREERKQMITNDYIKILGREPNQNDLNYFLNIGIREDELLKKMVDSQEHSDLVKARQEVITMKKEFNETQEELQQLRALKEDQKTIMDQMNQSIEQKNIALTKLQYDIRELQQNKQDQVEIKKNSSKKKYKRTFTDKLFNAFSDLLE